MWQRLAPLLRKAGHEVFTPSLTGIGERVHLASPQVNLTTHVTDVVNTILYEDLSSIVLLGFSYGGFVVSGVAEQVPIASIVFLDSFVPENGDRMVDVTSSASRDAILASARAGDIAVPPRPAALFHVNEKDRAWVDAMCTPHPLATMLDKIALTGARERIPKKAYIRAARYSNPGFDGSYAKLKSNPSWRLYDVPCGHDVMVDMPERLAEILLEVA